MKASKSIKRQALVGAAVFAVGKLLSAFFAPTKITLAKTASKQATASRSTIRPMRDEGGYVDSSLVRAV